MSDSNRTATDVVSVKSDGTPATGGYSFDSIDAFATGNWMLGKAAGTSFMFIRPNSFAHIGNATHSFGGTMELAFSDDNATALIIGGGTLATQTIQLKTTATGITKINGNSTGIMSLSPQGAGGVPQITLLDDVDLRIQGLLDGSNFRVNPRITTLMDPGAASPGAFQIFNKTNPAAGYKLLQLITDGSGAAPVKWDLDVDGHMKMTGAIDHEHNSFAANHQTSNEGIVGIDTTAAPRTVTLSSADALFSGRTIIIKDEGGNAGTNAITIDTQGTETIDGAASTSIATNYGTVRVYSNGSNWFTF